LLKLEFPLCAGIAAENLLEYPLKKGYTAGAGSSTGGQKRKGGKKGTAGSGSGLQDFVVYDKDNHNFCGKYLTLMFPCSRCSSAMIRLCQEKD
jgi:hypothetical protein